MASVEQAQPEQAVDEVLRLLIRGEPEAVAVRRLCDLAGDADEEHARAHLGMILEGYHAGMSLGWLLFGYSGVSVSGPELYLLAFDRGYRAGVRQKIVLKILPLCVLAGLGFAAYRWWW